MRISDWSSDVCSSDLIVGFLVSATGRLYLRFGAAEDFTGTSGGILGRLVDNSLYAGFGPVGGNLFLLALLLVSVTLATGLSWLAVMDRIGQWVLKLPDLFRRGSQQAAQWQEARAYREERTATRKVETELRARREKVKIEPTPAAQGAKSDRAKREPQLPLLHVGVRTGIPEVGRERGAERA